MSNRKKELKNVPRVCAKCGKKWDGKGSLDFHHYLPEVRWPEDGTGVYLCKQCHMEYHDYVRPHFRRNHIKTSAWYYSNFTKWLLGVIISIFIIYLLIL